VGSASERFPQVTGVSPPLGHPESECPVPPKSDIISDTVQKRACSPSPSRNRAPGTGKRLVAETSTPLATSLVLEWLARQERVLLRARE